MTDAAQPTAPPQYSKDDRWWWNGTAWEPSWPKEISKQYIGRNARDIDWYRAREEPALFHRGYTVASLASGTVIVPPSAGQRLAFGRAATNKGRLGVTVTYRRP